VNANLIDFIFFKIFLVFTEAEMNALMDRSDLSYAEKKPQIKEELMKLEGVFKRVNESSE